MSIYQSEKSLYFPGASSQSCYSDYTAAPLHGTGVFTVSLWFRSGGAQVGQASLFSKLSSDATRGFEISITAAGQIQVNISSVVGSNEISVVTTQQNVLVDRWHHVSVAYSGLGTASDLTVYVDGVAATVTVTRDNLSAAADHSNGISLGQSSRATSYFLGWVDEVSVMEGISLNAASLLKTYNYGTPVDLRTLASDYLTCYWYMGDGDTAPTILDHSGKSHNLTLTNLDDTNFRVEAPSDAPPRYSMYFQNGAYATRASLAEINGMSSTALMTYSFWVKPMTPTRGVTGVPRVSTLFSQAASSANGMAVYFGGTSLYYRFGSPPTAGAAGCNLYPTDHESQDWQHIVLYSTGSYGFALAYVNGIPVTMNGSINASATVTSGNPFVIGSMIATNSFTGVIADLAIWTGTLTISDAALLYNSGRYRSPTTIGKNSTLVGHWKLPNGRSSTTWKDYSKYARDLTMVNQTQSQIYLDYPGMNPYGGRSLSTKSLVFGGSATPGCIQTEGDTRHTIVKGSELSLSAWFLTTTTTESFLAGKAVATSPYNGYGLYVTAAGKLAFRWIDSAGGTLDVTSTVSYNNGIWHHAVATVSTAGTASGVTLYVDGVIVPTTTVSDTLTAGAGNGNTTFCMGGRAATNAYFLGSLDSVSLWNRVISEYEVRCLFGARIPSDILTSQGCAGLVGYWRLGNDYNSGFGGYVHDATPGSSKSSSVVGTVTVGSAPGSPTSVSGMSLTTNIEYSTIPSSSEFNFGASKPFSVSIWVYKTSSWGAGYQTLVAKRYDRSLSYVGWSLSCYASYPSFLAVNDATYNFGTQSSISLALNTWNHIVVSYNGGQTVQDVHFYVNGVLDSAATGLAGASLPTTVLNATLANTQPLAFGYSNGAYPISSAILDDVSIYDRPLSFAEVRALYRTGATRDAGIVAPDALVGWWRLGDGADTYTSLLNSAPRYTAVGAMTNSTAANLVTLGLAKPLEYLGDPTDTAEHPVLGTADPLGSEYLGDPTDTAEHPIRGTIQSVAKEMDPLYSMWGSSQSVVATLRYRMRANTVSTGSLVFWTVDATPDTTGSKAPEAVVASTIVIDYTFGDSDPTQEIVETVRTIETFYSAGTISNPGSGIVLAQVVTSGWVDLSVLSLPSSPQVGAEVYIKDISGAASSKRVTVSGNGKTVDGGSSVVLASNWGSLKLTYTASGWLSL